MRRSRRSEGATRITYVIALIAGCLLALGIMLVWAQFPDLGFTLISFGGDIILVYLVVDALLLRDERKRWKAVEKQVMDLIQLELSGIAFELALLSDALKVGFEMDWPRSEVAVLDKMRELAEPANRMELRKAKIIQGLFEREDRSFHERAEKLQNLQVRYSTRLEDPKLVELMIVLERKLESSDRTLSLTRDRWMEELIGEEYREQSIDDFLISLQDLLLTVVKAVDDGMIRWPIVGWWFSRSIGPS